MDATRFGLLGRLRPLLLLFLGLVFVAGCAASSTPAPRDTDVNEKPIDNGSTGSKGQGTSAGRDTSGGRAPSAAETNQQVVWTGRMQLQVADLNASLVAAQDAVRGLGGFVAASRRSAADQPVA